MHAVFARRVLSIVVAAVPMLGLSMAAASPASASVPASYCTGRSQNSLVKTYVYGSQRLALRCGTVKWGFVHIKPRWNATFDSMIALTIARGEKVKDLQGDGGTVIFSLNDRRCHELFRVIYNGGALYGRGVRPQGIITAYYSTTGTTTALAAAAAPVYRTDCAVIQRI